MAEAPPMAGTLEFQDLPRLQLRWAHAQRLRVEIRHDAVLEAGFQVTEVDLRRASQAQGGDGFRLTLKGMGDQEFQPDNLVYGFDEKFSLSGMFQRLDNFLEKGIEQAFQTYQANVRQEMAEMDTVKAALGQEFPQKDELALVRDNHSAVMRELKRIQDEPGYVSAWEPKVELSVSTLHSFSFCGTKHRNLF